MAKFYLTKQDLEDYEQEKRIQEFLQREGKDVSGIAFRYLTRSGRPKSSQTPASISIDQEIKDGESGRYLDTIGKCSEEIENFINGGIDTEEVDPEKQIGIYLEALGFKGRVLSWTKRMLRKSLKIKKFQPLKK